MKTMKVKVYVVPSNEDWLLRVGENDHFKKGLVEVHVINHRGRRINQKQAFSRSLSDG